jgi:hypothetical protein
MTQNQNSLFMRSHECLDLAKQFYFFSLGIFKQEIVQFLAIILTSSLNLQTE